jgi:glutamate/tyrosine decarboxylase-like PLP-dependent enzyme
VDAAYAGSAALLPEQQQHFSGLAAVDSYSFNPHKWLLTNFDCCAMWVADQAPLKRALSLTPVYLQGAGNMLDYKVGRGRCRPLGGRAARALRSLEQHSWAWPLADRS